MPQRVFVDANVFFSKTLMDWLFHLRTSNEGMFQTHSTEDVFAEVLYNMRRRHPQAPGHKTRRRLELMRECVDEVLGDFSAATEFTGKDADDYHIHAAATASRADLVLTANGPEDITENPDLEPYEIIAPDDFFMLVTDSSPVCLLPIVREQLEYWQSHPTHKQLDDALHRAECPRFAGRVRNTLQLLARTG